MSTIARSLFRSTFNITRRLASDQVPQMRVRCGNATCWRILDCNVRMAYFVTQSTCVDKEKKEMMAVWPNVVRDITDAVKSWNIPDVPEWIEKLLQYNVPGGKKICALTLIDAYKLLATNDQLTEENIRLVRILAWCGELMKAHILLVDDIQDRSLLRRGQPCWYRYNDINLAAINDDLMLENVMFYLIRKHFKGKDCYVNLLETFQHTMFETFIGQCLDLFSTNFGKKPNLDLFTMDRYNFIVNYKTASSFVMSVIAAMHFAGIKDPEMFRQAKIILLEIGHLFQVQDDYLSCFGDAKTCGKDNIEDIQEGKCSWLIVVALQRATPEQRKILEECYGFPDPEKIERVKQLFVDLDLPNAYSIFEEETYNLLNVHIHQISCGLPHDLFLKILERVYHRQS